MGEGESSMSGAARVNFYINLWLKLSLAYQKSSNIHHDPKRAALEPSTSLTLTVKWLKADALDWNLRTLEAFPQSRVKSESRTKNQTRNWR
jgi:hypothetical protein